MTDPKDRFALPHIQEAKAYVPGEQPEDSGWVKLNTNENPFPPSPKVESAIKAALEGLRLYPSPTASGLRKQVAAVHGLDSEWVLAGNGSDDVLNLLIRAYGDSTHKVGAMDPSYSLYAILCGIQGAVFEAVPFEGEMSIPVNTVASGGFNLFFLTSPNAPTGVGFSNEEVSSLAVALNGILVVDEAYGAFANESADELVKGHSNLLITRTFSKSHSLAGLRVGYLLGNPDIIHTLDKVRDSYNLDGLAQAGAIAALEDPGYYRAIIGKICRIRDYYLQSFMQRGWVTFPSQANFICTQPQRATGETGVDVAKSCFEFLKDRKILVRFFPKNRWVNSYLRISVGTEEDMDTLSEALDSWMF